MYVPLRVHGCHSLLTGVDPPAALVERALELGLPALALADVDTLAGMVDFLHATRTVADGIRPSTGGPKLRPIVAAEISDPSGAPGRLIALVKDAQGYKNLCKLVSARHLGRDPGERDAKLDGPESFRLIESAVRHREGLIFLADHPRLLIGLAGRVDERTLFAAISPAALRAKRTLSRARDPHRARSSAAWLETHGVDISRDMQAAQRDIPSVDHGARSTERDARRAQREIQRVQRDRQSAQRDAQVAPHDARVTTGDADRLEPEKVPAPAQALPAHEMIAAARAVGVATLAVPDVYCAWPSGYMDHRLRVAIKHTALLHDLPEHWLAEQPTHLLAPAEMRALYADLEEVPGPFTASRSSTRAPGAVERTLAVADECIFTPVLGENLFPTIELEAGETAASKLRALALAGAEKRYRPLRTEVLHRLDYELVTIERLGFAPYFLLVNRIADFAREQKIPCVGRGSAADSLVSYCLGLTDADPLRYKLAFERFLNPARRDRPDIDLDFCWRRRDEVLEHVYRLFGSERTAMISTLNHFGLRAAFREAALVEGIPPAEVNRWSRRLPHFAPVPTAAEDRDGAQGEGRDGDGRDGFAARGASRPTSSKPAHGTQHPPPPSLSSPPPPHSLHSRSEPAREPARGTPLSAELRLNPLACALHKTPEAAHFPFDDPRYERVLGAAARLLGIPRHYGLHPGGVVVAPGAITDFVACQRAAKGVVVTQLDKDAVEAIGLVKMDLLGNRALTVIGDCTQALAARGVVVDLESIPEDDARTAATLREGRTLGCFQVESPGMRNLLKQTGAATMDSVIQAVAMIRPGPASSGMKDAYVRRFRGLEPPHPPHPRLTDILWETQGVMLYQEDVMQVAACIAGMDLAQADLLRRALQKHRARDLEPLCARFISGAAEQGIARADALRVWDLVANFASFGFCKAHAVTYGRIAYRAVWLKTYYPAVFLASFLASETGYYDARVYVEEARRLGVPILPPDVNRSAGTFAVEWNADLRAGARAEIQATPSSTTAPSSAMTPSSATTKGRVSQGELAEPLPRAVRSCLRIGLGQVKGLSQHTLDALLRSREEHGPFLSLPDFLERTRAESDETERLIQCGAFDAFDRTRPELLWRLHLLRTPIRGSGRALRHHLGARDREPLDIDALEACRATPASRTRDALGAARARTGGWHAHGIGVGAADLARGESASLFPERELPAPALPRLPDLDWKTRARLEFELLGLTVSAHPMLIFPCPADERIAQCGMRPIHPTECGRLDHFRGGRITLRGWPVASRPVRTKNGRSMRFLTLEDDTGIAEVVLFPDVYERDGRHLSEFGTLCITGRVEDQMGACTLHAERIW